MTHLHAVHFLPLLDVRDGPGECRGVDRDCAVLPDRLPYDLAVGETVILLHPPLPSVGVTMRMRRGRLRNGSLADGYCDLDHAVLVCGDEEAH